jgi:hypothetical protein
VSVAADRWWVLHDEALVEVLIRVERGEITAAEAHALLLENTERELVEAGE